MEDADLGEDEPEWTLESLHHPEAGGAPQNRSRATRPLSYV